MLPAAGVAGRDLRANSAYTLHDWESLPEQYRQPLAATLGPAALAGVLVAGPGAESGGGEGEA
jgi:hypothetical protein